MTETSSTITPSGRVVRAALLLFPVGTIVFSIASFGFWWYKRQAVEDRSYAYASALRREMSVPALDRYVSILKEVGQLPEGERLAAVASFVESSMSAENMGYEPKRDRFISQGQEVSSVEAELTGQKRPREVHLILVPFGDSAREDSEAQALAGMMSLAHSLAGQRSEMTLRFAAVPLGKEDQGGVSALERLAGNLPLRQERLMKIMVLGGVSDLVLSQIALAFRTAQTGAVVESLPMTVDCAHTLAAMKQLRLKL